MSQTIERPSPLVVSGGAELDTSPEHFGELRPSIDALDHPDELRRRMNADGYLFLPGYLQRDEVLAARREVCQRLADAGQLAPGTDIMDAIINPDAKRSNFQPNLTLNNAPLHKLLYTGNMIAFYENFLGGPVLHFDFTWLRTVNPGKGTPSHCDSVYMNRGTQNLFTAWVPLGDIDFTLGGLMVLEGTNNHQRLRETYCAQDVDSYCENKPDAKSWGKSWGTPGWLQGEVNQIRRSIAGPQGRWLTTSFKAGDLLTFTIYTVHASMDNRSQNRIRLSSDSRYQLASEPADERWIGANPIGHSQAGKRGKIC